MSAEAPKSPGITAPVTPQEPQGCLPRFLRRFVGQTQPTYRPPAGLENFAARLNHGVTNVMNELNTARSQAELEKVRLERQEAKRISEEKETEGQKRNEFTRSRLQSLEEIKELAESFRIKARLACINTTVWEGKGQIRDITTPPESATERFTRFSEDDDLRALQAGYELVYSYDIPIIEKKVHHYDNNNPKSFETGYSWRYTTGRGSASLKVYIGYADLDGTSINARDLRLGKSGKYICIASNSEYGPLVGLNPPDREGIEEELEQLLVSESTARVMSEAIPSKLHKDGQKRLRETKSAPEWHRWKHVQTWFPDNS